MIDLWDIDILRELELEENFNGGKDIDTIDHEEKQQLI